MDFLNEYDKILLAADTLALATSVDNLPNVRIVNFYYDSTTKGKIYFATFPDNVKVEELAKNSKVAFTTIPKIAEEHVRVQHAAVQKSDKTICDLKEEFIAKIPSYKPMIEQFGEMLVLYEIIFVKAKVIVDFNQSDEVIF